MGTYNCAPAMHGGVKIPADWHVIVVARQLDDNPLSALSAPAFACCSFHAGVALRHVSDGLAHLDEGDRRKLQILVRDVRGDRDAVVDEPQADQPGAPSNTLADHLRGVVGRLGEAGQAGLAAELEHLADYAAIMEGSR